MATKGLPIISGAADVRSATRRPHRPPDGRLSVYLETYGCQMNVADTELMGGILREAGYAAVADPAQADVILVNTCAVREHAEERVFGRLGELTRFKYVRPWLVLGVTGCMAEHLRERIPARARAVDLVVGPDAYRHLPALIATQADEALLDVRFDRRENYLGVDPARREEVTAWVTIMRGCDRFCSFCIVPYVRGREKCVPPEEILRQVRGLADEGYREVCLLGQTVNSYRFDGTDFADLLRMVAAVDGIERVRFTSPHPAEFDEKMIAAMAEVPEVCPYVHLPLQSGADGVLARMRRDHTVDQYLRLVDDLRRAIPDLAMSTDVVVGFCGETEDEFQATCRLMESVRYDFAYMFRYSPREGTAAHRTMADDVPDEEKGRRLQMIIDLQERISAERHADRIGRTEQVLVIGPARKSPGHVLGRTPGFKATVIPGEWRPNAIVEARITGANPHTLFGQAIRLVAPPRARTAQPDSMNPAEA